MTAHALPVIVNRSGGAAAAAGEALVDRVEAAFAASGTAINLHLVDGDALADTMSGAVNARRIVIAGGDGTVATAAQIVAESGQEVGLLPLGTLNHLARDLAIPPNLDDAARLAATGQAIAIDLAEVNGRYFVNNASIGLYPSMVRDRDDRRERQGWPKWLATVPAAWSALARLPHHRLRIDMGEGAQPLVTSLLFVGNNLYGLEAGQVGKRASLADGLLSVFAVAHRTRWGLIWFALRTLAGRADRESDFVMIGECATLTVYSNGGSIELALDGELRRLASPLIFKIRPGAFNIVAPPSHEA